MKISQRNSREMSSALLILSAVTSMSIQTIAQTHKESCDWPARESIRDLQDEFMDCEDSFAGERAVERSHSLKVSALPPMLLPAQLQREINGRRITLSPTT